MVQRGERLRNFAALADGSGDVFLHVNTLQAAGFQAVSPGATLKIRVGQGPKGRQIDQVVSVDESTGRTAGRAPAAVRRRTATHAGRSPPPGRPQFRSRDGGHGKVVQPRQGVRLHHPTVRRQGCVHPCHGAGACRTQPVAGRSVGAHGCCARCQGAKAGSIGLSRSSVRRLSSLGVQRSGCSRHGRD